MLEVHLFHRDLVSLVCYLKLFAIFICQEYRYYRYNRRDNCRPVLFPSPQNKIAEGFLPCGWSSIQSLRNGTELKSGNTLVPVLPVTRSSAYWRLPAILNRISFIFNLRSSFGLQLVSTAMAW